MESKRYNVWVAFKHRAGQVVILGVFPTKPAAKDHVAQKFNISWNDPRLPDSGTWNAGGWTYAVRETFAEFTVRVLEIPDVKEVEGESCGLLA